MGTTPPLPTRYRGGLLFPVLLVALGMMFLLDHLVPGWELHKTWPALLILIGVFKLVDITRPPRPPEGPRV
jgi:hypothetical protein